MSVAFQEADSIRPSQVRPGEEILGFRVVGPGNARRTHSHSFKSFEAGNPDAIAITIWRKEYDGGFAVVRSYGDPVTQEIAERGTRLLGDDFTGFLTGSALRRVGLRLNVERRGGRILAANVTRAPQTR